MLRLQKKKSALRVTQVKRVHTRDETELSFEGGTERV